MPSDEKIKMLENKIPPLMLVVIFGLTMVAFSPLLPTVEINRSFSLLLSLALFSAGIFFAGSGVLEFMRKKTTVDPREPEKATTLVVSGVYHISRNPMYVGFALLLAALVTYLRSPVLSVGVLFFVVYMNRFQIEPEERVMANIFGEAYVRYKAKVRRWL